MIRAAAKAKLQMQLCGLAQPLGFLPSVVNITTHEEDMWSRPKVIVSPVILM